MNFFLSWLQGCGFALIWSGSGSSILGWIQIRIRIHSGSRALMTKKIYSWKRQKKFLPPWIRIRTPDPDPLTRLNPDPIRFRIRNPDWLCPLVREPSQDIDDKVVLLGEERKAVLRGWQEKGDWLRQVSQLYFTLLWIFGQCSAIRSTISFRRWLG